MTFELYKSTYMSAADKLSYLHQKRAEELKKHAAEKGISAFRGNDEFQSIYGHPFIFQNHPKLKNLEYFLGKFFITGFEDHVYGTYRLNYHGVKVIMQSDYGKKIRVELVVGPENHLHIDLEYDFDGGKKGYRSESFQF